ncbi:MAG: thiamine phosphate synthase [Acidobacteriota bacterium]
MSELCPPPLYAIADVETLGYERVVSAVGTMAASGVEWIQIRAKRTPDKALYALVEQCLEQVASSPPPGVRLWIDDRADIAAMLPAAGAHVGQLDLPPAAVRPVVGNHKLIGSSTHDLAQAIAAEADPAVDVVALGPIFPTASKENPDPVVGLDQLTQVRQRVRKPLVAIGGINASNIGQVLDAGADTAAVLGAVCHGDIAANCERLLTAASAGAVL